MARKYQVLSPDGFTIEFEPQSYKTIKDAKKALALFIARYTVQGYYSMSNRQRLPLEDIEDYCQLVKI